MNNPLATLFEKFLKERTYLNNVTPSTIHWYQTAFKNYRATLVAGPPPLPTKGSLQRFVVAMRDRGLKPITCNTNLVAMNAFCLWLHQEEHAPERVKLPRMRVEKRVLQLLDDKGRWEKRKDLSASHQRVSILNRLG
jgi:site-specific recombinase XerD